MTPVQLSETFTASRARHCDTIGGLLIPLENVPSADSASLEKFRPRFLSDLTRLGRDFDGGYVVNARAIPATSDLLSFGVSADWSFEADFLDRNPLARVFCFDYSVSKTVFRQKALDALNEVCSFKFLLMFLSLNWRNIRRRLSTLKHCWKIYFEFASFFSRRGVTFVQKGLSSESNDRFLTLPDVFRIISPADRIPDNSVFLKMDIEQSEYRVLRDLPEFRRYINGMVIEFHDLDILWSNFLELMNQLSADFEITHIHGNNYEALIPESATPKCLEVTLLKKHLIGPLDASAEDVTYPIPGLDRPNDPSRRDYALFSSRS